MCDRGQIELRERMVNLAELVATALLQTASIISVSDMTVVLSGGTSFAVVSVFAPHPANASQLRIALGSHLRLYTNINLLHLLRQRKSLTL